MLSKCSAVLLLLANSCIGPHRADDDQNGPLSSLAKVGHDAGCKFAVADLVADAKSHSPAVLDCLFEKWYPDVSPNATQMGAAGTYGEITADGVASVFSAVSEFGAGEMGPQDNFYDLGSGLGKMVLQASLVTGVGRAIGVELDKDRSDLAVAALAKLRAAEERLVAYPPFSASRVSFLQGDIRSRAIWANATVVYASSLCFPAFLMLELTTLLSRTLQPGAVVFSLTAFPGCHRGLRRLGTLRAAMTWTKSFEVHVYVLPPVTARPPDWAHLRDDHSEEAAARLQLQEKTRQTWLVEACVTDLAAEMSSATSPAIRRACVSAERAGRASSGMSARLPLELGNEIPKLISPDRGLEAILHHARGHYSTSAQCLLADLAALADSGIGDCEANRLTIDMFGVGEDMTPLGVPGQTVLHAALRSSLEISSKVFEALVRRRIDLERKDDAGGLPLTLAAQQGHATTVNALLQNRADVNSLDTGEKATALHYAVKKFKLDVVGTLLNFGASVNVKDAQGNLPHHNLWTRGGITKAARQWAGSEQSKQAEQHVHAAELLLAHRADANALDGSGKSLLHRFALQGEDDMVGPLLHARADLNLLDSWGNTPLHGTVVRSEIDMATTLLEGKADVDRVDRGGRSPLSRAVFFGHADMVEVLMQYKASPTLLDKSGSSPLKEAEKAGHADLVQTLRGSSEL